MSLVEENNDQHITIRLPKTDHDKLKEIAEKLGGRGVVAKLARYAIKQHILLAREKFTTDSTFWK